MLVVRVAAWVLLFAAFTHNFHCDGSIIICHVI